MREIAKKENNSKLRKIGLFAGFFLVTAFALYLFAPILGLHADFFSPKPSEEPSKTLESISNIQELTTDICSTTKTGVSKTLIDTRTNSTYVVTKMKDGRCWTVENLRYSDEELENNNLLSDSMDNKGGIYYNGLAKDKICPANMTLPSRDDFKNLAFVDKDLDGFDLAFIGYFDSEKMELVGLSEKGFYWTSDEPKGEKVILVSISKEKVVESYEVMKNSVASIRCVINGSEGQNLEVPGETVPVETTEPEEQSEQSTQESLDNNQTQTEPSSSQETSSQTSEPTSPTQTQ